MPANRIHTIVEIYAPDEAKARKAIVIKLLKLAAKIIPLNFRIEVKNSYRYTCPKCYRQFYQKLIEEGESAIIVCPNCLYQRLLSRRGNIIIPVIDDLTCGFECRWDARSGFIPEDGCPEHDC